MHTRIDWDDLRFVVAVADASSLAGAARALGVHHTTVLRRIGEFETRLGLRLFDRLPSGYALTAGGEELLAPARALAGTIADLERRIAGQDLRLEGELRIATTDTLLASVLPPLIAGFRAAHPGIRLEVSTANLFADLTRRDADIAIRPASAPPETLVGRRVCGVAFAPFAAPSLAGGQAEPDLARLPWVGPDASLASTRSARWMRDTVPDAMVVLRLDTLAGVALAAAAGIGAAVLPCYLGDTTRGLVRLGPVVEGIATDLWVLTHEDLRRTARVSAFTEFAVAELGRARDLFEGRRPA